MKKYLNKKVIIISIIVLAVVAFIAIPALTGSKNDSALNDVAYTTLVESNLTESVNVTGTIESGSSKNVYTTLNYPVKEVLVEVGEVVKAGDILARLDTANLAFDLQQAIYNAELSSGAAKITLENAKTAYESSQFSFEMGEISQAELNKSLNDYKNAQLNFDNKSATISVSKLRDQLNDSIIKAPIGGSVTMVNATVGNMASGILFVVEDTGNLKVTTGIKEFDVSKVKVGQIVEIKTDSTGDKIINGTVTLISPAANKGTNGQTVSSSDVQFDAEISINDQDPNLKIGMNARLSITIAQKKNILSVPFDAIVQNADGNDVIYIADKQGSGYVVKEVTVTTGLETDFHVEISGADIVEGLLVISNPADLKPNDKIKLKEAAAPTK